MSFTVLKGGLLTTVQDLGRPGSQRDGVAVGGALEPIALRAANLLVGNAESAAGLEITLVGPALRFDADHLLALVGADLGAHLDDRAIPSRRPFLARRGTTLFFTGGTTGCRSYLAVAGGIDVPLVLGGRGTDVRAGFGGFDGRPLHEGDVVRAGARSVAADRWMNALRGAELVVASWGAGLSMRPWYGDPATVRVLPGIEHEQFDDASRSAFVDGTFTVTAASNRMGCRLKGPTLSRTTADDLVSSPVTAGTVQVPAGGAPIVLLADRQTIGGYARIAQVITADLATLAQARPGMRLQFRFVERSEAYEALRARERELYLLRSALKLAGR